VKPEAAARGGQDYVFSSRNTGYHPGVTLAVAQEFGEVSCWNGFWVAARFTSGKWESVDLDLSDAAAPEHVAYAAVVVEADTPTHYLISWRGRYFALAKLLGPPDVAAEYLSEHDLPPWTSTERLSKKSQPSPPPL